MVFEENFLRLTVTVRSQKNGYFKNVNHNNVVVTKKLLFTYVFKIMGSHL